MSSTHLAFLRNLLSPTRGDTPRRRDVSETDDYMSKVIHSSSYSQGKGCDVEKIKYLQGSLIAHGIHTKKSEEAF